MNRITCFVAALSLLSTSSALALDAGSGGGGNGDDDDEGYADPRVEDTPPPAAVAEPEAETPPEPEPVAEPVREATAPAQAAEEPVERARAADAAGGCDRFFLGCRPEKNYQIVAGLSGNILAGDTTVPALNAALGVEDQVQFSASVGPKLDLSYFITDRFVLHGSGTWSHHDVSRDALNPIDLGDVNYVGLSALAQYRILRGSVQPYVGVGVLGGIFYGENNAPGFEADFENDFAPAGQLGVDVYVTPSFVLNADVKYSSLDVDLTLAPFTGSEELDVGPVQLSLGFGYRF